MDFSMLAELPIDSVLLAIGNSKNRAIEVTNNNVIKVLLVNGFFLTSVKGFSIEAVESVLMNPCGLLSKNQAARIATGNSTISIKVMSLNCTARPDRASQS